jgi:hypothetical protein
MGTKIERYDIPRRTVWSKDEKPVFDLIVSAISPDQPFDNCYEEKGRGNAVPLRHLSCANRPPRRSTPGAMLRVRKIGGSFPGSAFGTQCRADFF